MLDSALRPVKDRCLAPMAAGPVGRVPPLALSASSLSTAIGAGVAAGQDLALLAVMLWLLSRLADGLDGAVARARGTAGDLGGYVDILFDTIGYAAIPLGVAAGLDTRAGWIVTAVLLATFYVNAVSWTYVAAVLGKREAGGGGVTSVAMPRGLVEGTETIVFFTLALAVPSIAVWVFGVMAAAVAITVAERLWWARSVLR